MSARFIVGDTRAVLASLPAGSVDLVLSSPPFLALRSYLPDDHPDKELEIGSEPTPGEFIDTLLDVTEACARVLAPHGTLAFELGDTYSGAGGYGSPDSPNPAYGNGDRFGERWEGRTVKRFKKKDDGWPEAKSLALIPESYRWALAYGRNPFTGRETDRWRVRNVVRWVRPNPPVGALGDKFRPATSDLVIACKARDRWFDLDAVRISSERPPHTDNRGGHVRDEVPGRTRQVMNPVDEDGHRIQANPAGAPPLDWWSIPPGGYQGSHYAVWPAELCTRPIEAMCPRRVCLTCGKPSCRIVDAEYVANRSTNGQQSIERKHIEGGSAGFSVRADREATTTGWSTCGCPGTDGIRLDGYHEGTGWRPGIVLDPFAGSGTTLMVATGHGRDAIGIDLDERNADLARERIGMFLDIEDAAAVVDVAVAGGVL